MRVGIVGPTAHDLFASNVADGLRELGVEPVLLGPAHQQTYSTGGRFARTWAAQVPQVASALEINLLQRVRAADVGCLLNLQGDVTPATVGKIKAQGIPTGLWFPDAVTNVGRMFMWFAKYDAVFFKEPLLAERAREFAGINAHYLAEACNPDHHRPPPGDEPGDEPEVAVAGNMYAPRMQLLRRLARDGFPIRVYGPAWATWLGAADLAPRYFGRSVFGLEKSKVYRRASAVLNNLHPGEMDGMNCRLFEAAGAGACLVTERRATLGEHFLEGSEVHAYSTYAELTDGLSDAMADPGRALAMGNAASRRAHQDHRYATRLKIVLEQLSD